MVVFTYMTGYEPKVLTTNFSTSNYNESVNDILKVTESVIGEDIVKHVVRLENGLEQEKWAFRSPKFPAMLANIRQQNMRAVKSAFDCGFIFLVEYGSSVVCDVFGTLDWLWGVYDFTLQRFANDPQLEVFNEAQYENFIQNLKLL